MADTIPSTPSTTATIAVGSTVNGMLDFVGDHDWYRINLVAGQAITVTLSGSGTLTDTYLRIYDSAGNEVLFENDDMSGGSLDSQLSFISESGGTYYIDVGAWNDEEVGNFQLSVSTYSPPPLATYQQIADQLISGYWEGEAHHFNVGPGGTLTVNLSALTSSGQTLARAALALWTDIIGVKFQEVTGGAQIMFDDIDDPETPGPDAYSTAEWTFDITTEAFVNISTSWLTQNGTGLSTYSFTTYIHEIGHALGLGHAGDYNGDAAYPYDANFQNDSWSTSIMSYFNQTENTYFASLGYDLNFPSTPMIADILAMQQMYGLSTTTRLGDTTYGSSWTTSMGAICLFDSGGNDTISLSGSSWNNLINLNPGTFSNVLGEKGNVSIALSVIIENAIGGGGRDTLIGNDAANVLTGGANIDTLTGGAGADTFRDTRAGLSGDTITDFGAGDKIILTDAVFSGFTYNLSGSTLTYSGGSLTLSGVSGNLIASAAAGGGVQLTLQATVRDVADDFNGDGRSDVLWRHDSGLTMNWLGQTNGGFALNPNAWVNVGNDWHVVGTGDFNGDGRDDIMWRNSSGMTSQWQTQANGSYTPNNVADAMVGNEWQVAGVGDFNGDGRDDVIWRNSSGAFTEWLAQPNGSFVSNDQNASTTLATDWHVIGTGDFNGDGKDDVLWRHDSGLTMNWLGQANGGFVLNPNAWVNVGTDWHVVGIGDFNGDGRDDIMWRNNSGMTSQWQTQANGSYVPNNAADAMVGLEWQVSGIGDYNGDGRDEVIWRNTATGAFTGWLAQPNGSFLSNHQNASTTLPSDWHVQNTDTFWM